MVFNYATSTGTNVSVSNVLQVVVNPKAGDETDISDEVFHSKNRTGIAWMMRKGPKFHKQIEHIHERPDLIAKLVEGSSMTKADLRKFEYFVTYDPYTYWSWFAAMSGTVSVVYPLANQSKEEWALGTFLGSYLQDVGGREIPGVAYGWEGAEINYARQTMHELRGFLLEVKEWGAMTTVPRFTRDCYRYKQGDRDHFEGATLIRDTYPIIEDW
jgi:hypothetical protein